MAEQREEKAFLVILRGADVKVRVAACPTDNITKY